MADVLDESLSLFYDDNADLSIIQRRKVGVIGYGSQGVRALAESARFWCPGAGRSAGGLEVSA